MSAGQDLTLPVRVTAAERLTELGAQDARRVQALTARLFALETTMVELGRRADLLLDLSAALAEQLRRLAEQLRREQLRQRGWRRLPWRRARRLLRWDA